MSNRRQALSRARQYRTCPPGKVAQDKRNTEKLKRHMAVCPYCSGQEQCTSDSWEMLVTRISQSAVQQPVKEEPVFAGQLYYVKTGKTCWHGNYYYNPPMVLVLAFSPGMDDAVTVAQTYHELCLAGPGDLILYDSQTGCGDLFVECWHTYTLNVDDLGFQVGKVSDKVVQAVLNAGEKEENIPDWAPLTLPMANQDPRIYFREMEVECGFIFSAPAVATLIQQLEKPAIHLLSRTVEELKAELACKTPGLQWPVEPETSEQVLALARHPDEMLPLAAGTADIRHFQINLAYIHRGRVKRFRPLIAEILLKHETESRVKISGRIMDLPSDARKPELIVFWPDYTQKPLLPLKIRWDPSGANFFMTFARARRLSDTWVDAPAMALICDSDKGK